jgi:pimeloyl-ACP methyl ester carboxylesterase
MILLLITFLLIDLLSIGFLILDVYLWREWWEFRGTLADNYAERCLYGAIALLGFMLGGKSLWTLLLSKRCPGEDQPERTTSEKHKWLERPDGSLIYIEEWGNPSGQPIVFVHGWNATRTEWYYQRKRFEKDYRLILMDLAGLGKSTCPLTKDFSLSKMALDLNAVIESTEARNPVLWGHSIGGMTILTLLCKHRSAIQQPIKGVILQHTTYTNPVRTILFSKALTALQKPVLEPLCWLLIILSPLVWFNRWMSYLNGNSHIMTRLLTFAGTQSPRQLDFITLLSTLAPPAVTARGVLGMFRYDVTAQLPSIDVPALIIGANRDRLTKPVASHQMKAMIPGAQIAEVKPAGHQGLVERHREVNVAAERFLLSLR